jgi:hypothetical protein
MVQAPGERDDLGEPLFAAPSFYSESTPEMRQAGAETLLRTIPELDGIIGPYSIKNVVAKVFAAMLKIRMGTGAR